MQDRKAFIDDFCADPDNKQRMPNSADRKHAAALAFDAKDQPEEPKPAPMSLASLQLAPVEESEEDGEPDDEEEGG